MFLHDENQEEEVIDEEVEEGDYTIHLVEEDDGSSSLIATNQTIDLPNQTENVTAVLNLENGQSSPSSSPSQTNSNNKRNKKRKTNPKTNNNGITSNGTGAPTALAAANNLTSYEQFITTSNYDQIIAPRNALISHNSHYSPQPLSEEEIFGHSIAASLRKFDAKQKEIVKLRLQEVIVNALTET